MKFAEHLTAHITPEWRKQYINYEEMKCMLYNVIEEAPSPESADQDTLARYFTAFDEQFFSFCDRELKKINTFYSEKLAEATRKYATLVAETSSSVLSQNNARNKKKLPTRKLQELKLAFSEFYLSLILLQNYQNLNFTGFRKILKKHDKLLSVTSGTKWREQNVDVSHFHTNQDIHKLISETETTVTMELEGGDRQKAMKKLRVPPLGEQKSPWITFKVGLFSGSFIVLFIAVVLTAIFHEDQANLKVAFRLYRGPMLLIEFIFLLGVNVYGWRSSGVNHVLIFELDPRNHLSEQDLMEIAAILGVVWTLSLLSFLFSSSLSIPPYVNPLALTFIMIFFLINPLKVFRHEARFWLLRVLGRIFAAPFFHVGFADFWLADQLNSLTAAFLDFHFVICFYLTNEDWEVPGDVSNCVSYAYVIRPIVHCLPAWFRFAQCLRRYYDSREAFPHLANALKYSTTFFVVTFASLKEVYKDNYESTMTNTFVYEWIVASIVSSCYTYTWDIKMDWGLFDSKSGEHKFLREETVYNTVGFYYFAIVEDLLLRRFVWNFFRLENEHLNNCGKFRAVRDISVAPLNTSDDVDLLKMMDEDEWVTNRKKKKSEVKKWKESDRQLFITSFDEAGSKSWRR
ncbi:hypothetical protein RUM43_003327 [Polyplax serrata]|uniref:Xenotropic and polytropic retrovirus receptor 1 n=1 Tax=Polyplax serrata TaxID=468196 RepID=A0AAN8S349_POLSC